MEKRFVKVDSEGTLSVNEVWVDRETGVNYLFHYYGNSGGITPLLKADGTPAVTPLKPED